MRDRTLGCLRPPPRICTVRSRGAAPHGTPRKVWPGGRPVFVPDRASETPVRLAHVSARQNGFTLMELLITIAVATILAVLALPDFSRFLIRGHILTQANSLVADLSFARSEAIRRQEPVTLCVSTNAATCVTGNWQSGWITYLNVNNASTPPATPLLRVHSAFTDDVVVASTTNPVASPAPGASSTTSYLTFKPDGTAIWGYTNSTTPSTFAALFAVCDASPRPGDTNGIDVTVDNSGMISSTTQTQPCPTP